MIKKSDMKTDVNGWEKQFKENLGEMGVQFNKIIFIPDTNFIMRRYASKFLYRKMNDVIFKIPHLVILEIERKYNQTDSEKQIRNKLRLAFNELLFLKEHGAGMLSDCIPNSLLSGFLSRAGEKLNDAWIRKEILDFAHDGLLKPVVFLTCDLANAFSASSEGLFTLYFSRIESESFELPEDPQLCALQVSDLIIDTAIMFEETDLQIFDELTRRNHVWKMKGIWEGKTPNDWLNDSFQVDKPIPQQWPPTS